MNRSDSPGFSFGLDVLGDDEERKIQGVVLGKVINPLDPTGQGRVQVQLPFIDSLDMSAWARVAVPLAGPLSGMYTIPNPGDRVLVAFEHGSLDHPYIIGSLWDLAAPPPLPTPLAQMRMIRTPIGNTILFTEEPPSINIVGPSLLNGISVSEGTQTIVVQMGGSTIAVSEAGVVLQSGGTTLAVTPEGIVMTAENVSITGIANVTIFGSEVHIN